MEELTFPEVGLCLPRQVKATCFWKALWTGVEKKPFTRLIAVPQVRDAQARKPYLEQQLQLESPLTQLVASTIIR